MVTWREIKDALPPNLKISPVACIPHKSRAYHMIIDLSFRLREGDIIHPSVNNTTNKLLSEEAMVQLGKVIRRMVAHTASNRKLILVLNNIKL